MGWSVLSTQSLVSCRMGSPVPPTSLCGLMTSWRDTLWVLGRGPAQAPSPKVHWMGKDHCLGSQAWTGSIPHCEVWLSCSPALWETSPVSKRLSKENHFWQPLGNGRSPLTAPALASVMAVTVLSRRHPVVSPPAKIHLPVQQLGTARTALAFPLRTGSCGRSPAPSFACFSFGPGCWGFGFWGDPCLSGAAKGDQQLTHRTSLRRCDASALAGRGRP